MRIREIKREDAKAYQKLCYQLDEETEFRLYEPGERTDAPEDYQSEIDRFLSNPQSAIFVIEEETSGDLVGYLQAIGRTPKRIRHVVSVNIGILQAYTGRGLGGEMFHALEEWAKKNGIHRIDLTVMENNRRARRLYDRLGFQEEGIKRQSMFVLGKYIDEIYLSKWLA